MKLFGKKGGNTPPPDNNDLGEEEFAASPDTADDGLGDPAPALGDDLGEDPEAKALSAPTRSMASVTGGGRKNLLILLLLVVAAGCGGGYFYFMGDSTDYSQPVHVTAKTSPMPVADKPSAPPQPKAAAPDTLAAATAAKPGDPMAAPVPPATSAADPLATPAPQPAAPDALGKPPADEANAMTPVPVGAKPGMEPAPGEQVPDMPPQDLSIPNGPNGAPAAAMTATATPAAAPKAGAAPAPAAPGSAEDLPLPADAALEQPLSTTPAGAPQPAAKPAEAAPSWAAPGTAAIPGTSNPAAKASSPTDAELAIVQNAAVLDQLTRPVTPAAGAAPAAAGPAGTAPTGMPFDPNGPKPSADAALKQIQDNLEKVAIKRQLPSGYMIIRKEADAGDVDSRLTAARVALSQGRSPAALELFDDLKKDYPKDKRILMGRAVALQKLGQNDEALAAYEAVLNRDPKNLDALSNMLGLLKSKDPGLAVEKLQELRDTYPYQGDITAQLGIAYASNGQYDQALKYLEMADSLKPGSAYVLYNRAVLLDKMGHSADAALLYRSILRKAADGELDQELPLDTIRNRLAVMR